VENPWRAWAVAPPRLPLKISDEGLGHVLAVKAATSYQRFGNTKRHVRVVCIAEDFCSFGHSTNLRPVDRFLTLKRGSQGVPDGKTHQAA